MPQEPRQATAATQPYPDRRRDRAAVDRHSAGRLERAAERRRAHQRRQDLHAVLDGADRGEARHDGRRELAAELVRSRDTPSICLRERPHQLVRRCRTSCRNPSANQVYMGGRFTQADADDRGILAALDVTTNKLAWRQAVARDLLQRLGRHGRRLAVRRPQRRAAHGARQSERQAAVGVHDGRRRQHDRDDVRVERRSARRRARGRRRVRGRDARRRHLDVLADRHDEVVACDDRGAGRRRRRLAGRRPAAGAGGERPVDVEHGRQLYAEACVACHGEARRRRPRRRPDARRGLAARDDPRGLARPAATRCRRSAARTPRPICATSRATSSTCWRNS